MLIAGREAGDITDHGGGRVKVDTVDLDDLGVQRDLAADAVVLARVPDEVWTAWGRAHGPSELTGPTSSQQDPNAYAPGRHVGDTAFRLFQHFPDEPDAGPR